MFPLQGRGIGYIPEAFLVQKQKPQSLFWQSGT